MGFLDMEGAYVSVFVFVCWCDPHLGLPSQGMGELGHGGGVRNTALGSDDLDGLHRKLGASRRLESNQTLVIQHHVGTLPSLSPWPSASPVVETLPSSP